MSAFESYKKRPCRICGRWFRPDPRVGRRQRVCSADECQRARRRRYHAGWRERTRGEAIARRLEHRAAEEAEGRDLEPLRVPPPLDRLPWEMAQSEFGSYGSDFLGEFGKVLVQHMQTQLKPQAPDSS